MASPCDEIDKTKPFGKHCQVPWFARTDQGAQNPTQVVCHRRRKITLLDFLQAAKPRAASPARIAQMSERPLHSFATKTLQTTPAGSLGVAAIASVRGLPLRRLVLPATLRLSLGFRDVRPLMSFVL